VQAASPVQALPAALLVQVFQALPEPAAMFRHLPELRPRIFPERN
jgi:hypothetical protein